MASDRLQNSGEVLGVSGSAGGLLKMSGGLEIFEEGVDGLAPFSDEDF